MNLYEYSAVVLALIVILLAITVAGWLSYLFGMGEGALVKKLQSLFRRKT